MREVGKRLFSSRALTAIGVLGLSAAFSVVGVAEESTPAAKPVTAGKRYKNIRVLKDLPADQLIPVMHGINLSLGVRCDFCHVQGAFEKDDKPMKGVARQMVVLVQHINKREKVIGNKATCYMCHHGRPEPERQPPTPKPPPGGGAR